MTRAVRAIPEGTVFHMRRASPVSSPVRTLPAPAERRASSPIRHRAGRLNHQRVTLSEARALAIAEERGRLGRELHDCLGQALACASAYSSAAADMIATGDVEAANWAVHETMRALEQAHSDLRESICALRSVDVDPRSWVAGLRGYAAFYQQQWGVRCDVHVDEAAIEACGAEGRVALTRIVQEALSNIRKHAHADEAAVRIGLEGGWVILEVVDQGRGFDSADRPAGHYGLDTMEERARAVGGQLTVSSSPAGTRLWARLPAHPPAGWQA